MNNRLLTKNTNTSLCKRSKKNTSTIQFMQKTGAEVTIDINQLDQNYTDEIKGLSAKDLQYLKELNDQHDKELDADDILHAKDLNDFIKAFLAKFEQADLLDILKAVQILVKYERDFIAKNLTNKELNKLTYKGIQNEIPKKIVDVIGPKYHFSHIQSKILDRLCSYNFQFNTLIYNHHVLKAIDSVILEEQKKNISAIKDTYNFDAIFDKEQDAILQYLQLNATTTIYGHIDELQLLVIDKDINDISELNKFLTQHPQYITKYIKEIVGTLLAKKICKTYDYNINVAMLFAAYIPKKVDIIKLILQTINNIDTNVLFTKFIGDPWEFIDFDDSTEEPNNIVYSMVSPYEFSSDRSGPLLVIESEVLRGNNDSLPHHNDLLRKYRKDHGLETDEDEEDTGAAYTSGYEGLRNVGVGSYFDEVAVLEFIQGNDGQIKQALINDGFQKVYLNNSRAWTSKEYRRIAYKTKIKRLLVKVN